MHCCTVFARSQGQSIPFMYWLSCMQALRREPRERPACKQDKRCCGYCLVGMCIDGVPDPGWKPYSFCQQMTIGLSYTVFQAATIVFLAHMQSCQKALLVDFELPDMDCSYNAHIYHCLSEVHRGIENNLYCVDTHRHSETASCLYKLLLVDCYCEKLTTCVTYIKF